MRISFVLLIVRRAARRTNRSWCHYLQSMAREDTISTFVGRRRNCHENNGSRCVAPRWSYNTTSRMIGIMLQWRYNTIPHMIGLNRRNWLDWQKSLSLPLTDVFVNMDLNKISLSSRNIPFLLSKFCCIFFTTEWTRAWEKQIQSALGLGLLKVTDWLGDIFTFEKFFKCLTFKKVFF